MPPKPQRQEFPRRIAEALAKRTGYVCSNPDCRSATIGPHSEDSRTVSLGVAAHIKAAAPGGPRFDSTMSEGERRSISNAVWLCQNCAKLIDSDVARHPASLLVEWRLLAEHLAFQRLGRPRRSLRQLNLSLSEPKVFNAPLRNEFFTGRDSCLAELRRHLANPRSIAFVGITGLPGIGKTQTAIEYAYRFRFHYSAVLWCRGDSREALIADFLVLATLLRLPQAQDNDREMVVRSVIAWLETTRNWLLVIDNVDDLSLLPKFESAGGAGACLVTTRLPTTDLCDHEVELTPMGPEEGALLLLRRARLLPTTDLTNAPSDRREAAVEISRDVGGLPLALAQAAAFIQEMPSTPAEYVGLYRSVGSVLRSRQGTLSDLSVTATFSLALERTEVINPAAAQLVRSLAFLEADAIPEEIFTSGGSAFGGVGSSRVDLQACKLEYSIVSPK